MTEKDLLRTPRNLIVDRGGNVFAVVGTLHLEDASIADLRYVRRAGALEKAGPEDASLLLAREPAYARKLGDAALTVVPHDRVERVLDQFARARALDGWRAEALEALSRESRIPAGQLGVTGSALAGVPGPASDLDVTAREGRFQALLAAAWSLSSRSRSLGPLDEDDWRAVYDKRRPDQKAYPFKAFLDHERRKRNRFMASGGRVDLLATPEGRVVSPEDLSVQRIGPAVVTGRVADGSSPYGHPAVYRLDSGVAILWSGRRHMRVSAVASFTHTYVAQAFEGERVTASGVLQSYATDAAGFDGPVLVVGTSREAPGEWVLSDAVGRG
jgi:predicted nucleotidyltransferase